MLAIILTASSVFAAVGLVPLPNEFTEKSDFLELKPDTTISYADKDARLTAEMLAEWLRPAMGFKLPVKRGTTGTIVLDLLEGASLGKEGYQLKVDNSVVISAETPVGLFYGAQTVRQLLPPSIFSGTRVTDQWEIKHVEIKDVPRFQWRGMHLDVGRHFFAAEDIKKFIDILAIHKLNIFHWHLTEDQGWRVEIKKYPKLTEVGAFRASTPPYGNRKGSDDKRYGGFYTQKEIREIVAYAAERHITVVPDIDMPGHMAAAIASYPEFGCNDIPNYNPTVKTFWGMQPYILLPTEETFGFVEDVLDEICDMFPSEYIHIGGDEAPKGQWEKSTIAQDVIKWGGLHNECELQSYFIQRVEKMLDKKGRRLIGWDEIREGGLSPKATVMSWRGVQGGIASAREGHDVVMAPNSHTYFDYYQNHSDKELAKGKGFEAIGGYLPINKVYSFDPVMPGALSPKEQKHVLGVQAQLWTEYMKTWDKVEYMAFPRIAAIAEVAWTLPQHKDYLEFVDRLVAMRKRYEVIGLNSYTDLLPQFRLSTAPVANNQNFTMRAAELLALPILLAGSDVDHDPLTYTIVSPPSNGSLIGTPPRLEYVPKSAFRGIETFTYRVSDRALQSDVATVSINVVQQACTSAQAGNGPTDSLYLHVPSHLVNADISENQHVVKVTGDIRHEYASMDMSHMGRPAYVSRNDFTNKTMTIKLGATSRSAPLSISFKLMPTNTTQNAVVMQAPSFVIESAGGSMVSSWTNSGSGQTSVTNSDSVLKNRSCNHFAVVLGNNSHTTYFNGYPTLVAVDTDNLNALNGIIQIGPYPGKIWDIRIYNRVLAQQEILTLGGADCSDERLSATPIPGYPNYLFGVYINEWWADNAPGNMEWYQYYVHSQDMVYERNLFEGGMYPNSDLAGYHATQKGRQLHLTDGIINVFAKYTCSDPLTQANAQHWLHENFHSYQGGLSSSIGFGGNKFMLESTASWGAFHCVPGVSDNLLGYYTLHPHLPVYTDQSSPVDMKIGYEFKGGHQYGAAIFWHYITEYVSGKNLVGDIFNNTMVKQRPVEAAHYFLNQQGHSLKAIFGDFAARITTWDLKEGAAFRASEASSLSRMKSVFPTAERHDAKITTTYNGDGTGNVWTSVPTKYIPGSWAFNAYKVEVASDSTYTLAVKPDMGIPTHSAFQARVVIHKTSGVRQYHVLDVAAPGLGSEIQVQANAGDDMYLIVATTPDVYKSWDWYPYQYKISKDSPAPPVSNGSSPVARWTSDEGREATATDITGSGRNKALKIFILAGQSNMQGHGYAIQSFSPRYIGTLDYYLNAAGSAKRAEYDHLVDGAGQYVSRPDVWTYYDRADPPAPTNAIKADLVVGQGSSDITIGPELGFGWMMGDQLDNQILLIKTCWGGKSLAVDFRPPSSEGTVGSYYTKMINMIESVTSNLSTYFPGYDGNGYEIAGFGWHQGWNDYIDQARVDEYEANLANLIRDVRADLGVPNLPFVVAGSGMTTSGRMSSNSKGNQLQAAQTAPASYPEFAETRNHWRSQAESPWDAGYHWCGNFESYYRVGTSMAKALIPLLSTDRPKIVSPASNPAPSATATAVAAGRSSIDMMPATRLPISKRLSR